MDFNGSEDDFFQQCAAPGGSRDNCPSDRFTECFAREPSECDGVSWIYAETDRESECDTAARLDSFTCRQCRAIDHDRGTVCSMNGSSYFLSSPELIGGVG